MVGRRHPDLPEVELLSTDQGSAPPPEPEPPVQVVIGAPVPGLGLPGRETAGGQHDADDAAIETVVDHDAIGHDTVGELLINLKDYRDRRQVSAMASRAPMGSPVASFFQKRTAQVMQATLVDLPEVLTALTDPAFWDDIKGLSVDASSASATDREVVLEGRLRMPRGFRRKVQLRVYPTPSENLTVLELLPLRRWMPQTRRYLRAGVPAITALKDRIEAAAPRR